MVTPPPRGERVLAGRYHLQRVLGRGAMGAVWEAEDTFLRRPVAVKEVVLPAGLSPQERAVSCERTLREARAIARLGHPNVVTLFDVLDEDSRPWVVMELVPSRSLADVVREDGPVQPSQAASVGLAILGALEAAHAAGITHRDVKPGNILLAHDGRVKLTDFGIARAAGDTTITGTGLLVGSPSYLAPEIVRGQEAGPAGDLWGLGATLYAAVEGRAPFSGTDAMDTLAKVVQEPPAPFQRSGPLVPVLRAMLEKNPAIRASAQDARRLLLDVLRATGTSAEATVALSAMLGHAAPGGGRHSVELAGARSGQPDATARRAAAGVEPGAVAAIGGAGPAAGGPAPAPGPGSAATSAPADAGAAASGSTIAGPGSGGDRAPEDHPGDHPENSTGAPTGTSAATSAGTAAGTPAGALAEPGPNAAASQLRQATTQFPLPPFGVPPSVSGHPAGPLPTRHPAPGEHDALFAGPAAGGPSWSPPDAPPGGAGRLGGHPAFPDGGATYRAHPPPGQLGERAGHGQDPGLGALGLGGFTLPPGDQSRPRSAAAIAVVVGLVLVALVGAGLAVKAMRGGSPAVGQTKTAAPSATGTAGPAAVPTGYVRYAHPGGFSVAVPKGWQAQQRSAGIVDVRDPESNRFLRLIRGGGSGAGAQAQLAAAEPAFRARHEGYRRVQLGPVSYRGYDAADWDFTYRNGEVTRRVLYRAFVADGTTYAVYLSAPEPAWADSRPFFDTATATFAIGR